MSSSFSSTPFLIKLYDLIEDGEYKDCIAWHYSKEDQKYRFFIKSERVLLEKALVSIGMHCKNMHSFFRQLNRYGFSRRLQKSGHTLCWHGMFQKGNREQVLHIKRRSWKRPAADTPYMARLYDLIEEREYHDCIAWHYSLEDQTYHICIKSEQGLLKKALVSIGVHKSSMASFYTSLNSYGFSGRLQKNGHTLCSHSLFQKGNREQVSHMKPRSPNSLAVTETADTSYLARLRNEMLSEELVATRFGVGCGNDSSSASSDNLAISKSLSDTQDTIRAKDGGNDVEMLNSIEPTAEDTSDVPGSDSATDGGNDVEKLNSIEPTAEDTSDVPGSDRATDGGNDVEKLNSIEPTAEDTSDVSGSDRATDGGNDIEMLNSNTIFSHGWPMKDQDEFEDPLTFNDSTSSDNNLAISKSTSDSTDCIRATDEGNDVETLSKVELSTRPRQSDESFENVSVSTMVGGIFDNPEVGGGNGVEFPIPVAPTPAKQPDDSFENLSAFDDAEDDASNDIEMKITDEHTAEDSHARLDSSTSDDSLTSDESLILHDSSSSDSTSDASDSVCTKADEGGDVEMTEPSSQQSNSVENGIYDDAEDDPLPPEIFPPAQPNTNTPPANHSPFRKRRLVMADELLRIGMEEPRDISLHSGLEPSYTPAENQPPFRKRRVAMCDEALRVGMEMSVEDSPLPSNPMPSKRRKRSAPERQDANGILLLDDAKENSQKRRPTKKVRTNTMVQEASPVKLPPKAIPQRRSGGAVISGRRSDNVAIGYLAKKSQPSNAGINGKPPADKPSTIAAKSNVIRRVPRPPSCARKKRRRSVRVPRLPALEDPPTTFSIVSVCLVVMIACLVVMGASMAVLYFGTLATTRSKEPPVKVVEYYGCELFSRRPIRPGAVQMGNARGKSW